MSQKHFLFQFWRIGNQSDQNLTSNLGFLTIYLPDIRHRSAPVLFRSILGSYQDFHDKIKVEMKGVLSDEIWRGICKIFNTTSLPKMFNFMREKCGHREIFGQNLRMGYVLLIYFEQIVSFCAIFYSNTNSLQLFCENSNLNSANFTERVFFLR